MQWTKEQEKAISERGSNLLLSAAAGSGKTTVLVERILRLIEEGADLDRILVVTFTRAAASDMRAKLASRLHERSRDDQRFREQERRLERASISTLHSFCSEFLRAHFEAAEVDPAFSVLDDTVSGRMREEALDETIEEAYDAPDEGLMDLDYGRGPKGVRALTASLMKALESRPDPEAWLRHCLEDEEEMESLWFGELVNAAHRSIREAMLCEREATLLSACPENYRAAMRQDLEALEGFLAVHDYDALRRCLSEYRQTRVKTVRGQTGDSDDAQTAKDLRKRAKTILAGTPMMKHPTGMSVEDLKLQLKQRKRLAALALTADEKYAAKKAELSGLTFDDLERRTLRALQNDALAREMREQYEYVFVDEYQDTSDIQEAIVGRIAREGGLFMVGDVKQSIYRFRQAEPRLFIEKLTRYRDGSGGRLLPLTRNFRSTKNILSFVNHVFERVMTGGDSEIVYDELARLNPSDAAKEGAPVEIHLLENAWEAEEADEAILELKNAERQGLLIARRIRELMEEDGTLQYRDIAVLTRAKTSALSPMLPILLAQGVPAYADGAAGYFDSVEIMLAQSLLRLVVNRRGDLELLGVLHSPLVGLNAEQLARIRIACPRLPFIDAARAAREGEDSPLEEEARSRLREIFDRIERWRALNGQIDLGSLVACVLEESGLYLYASALPGGEQRRTNLDRLVMLATKFDREISGSLARFLQHTEDLRAHDDGSAPHLGENDNVVRMMTIHKSKGLEFRVVFGALLERRYQTAAREKLYYQRDLGFAFHYYDQSLRSRRITAAQSAIAERNSAQDAAEEMRVLYVLLTRARERLVLTASVRQPERAEIRWKALGYVPFAAASYIDLIMATLGEDCDAVRVEKHALSELSVEKRERTDGLAEYLEIAARPERYLDPSFMEKMAWRYPDDLSTRKPLKLTVTGLLREIQGPEVAAELAKRPAFLMGDDRGGVTGMERGTAYHRAMQLVDLDRLRVISEADYINEIARQLNACAAERLMTQVQRAAVDPKRIAAFLTGPVGKRLLGAKTVRREWPFNVKLKASEALTAEEAGRFGEETLLVQGTIDCCFVEDGRWVLLDYKTDRSDDHEALKRRYQEQLGFYALALERLTGMEVKEQLLCLIGTGEALRV